MALSASSGERLRASSPPVRWPLLAVLFAALLVRLLAAGWWEARLPAGTRFAFPDSYSYWELGRTIAAGEPYQFGSADARVFRTPGYPLVLAGVIRIGGAEASPLLARCVGALLGTLAVAGVYWLGASLLDARRGLVAALFASFYPGAIALSVFVLSEALFVPLMLMHLALWVVAWQSSSRWKAWSWSLAAGVAAAAATLARPSWLLFAPLAVAAGIVFAPLRLRHLELGTLVLVGLVLSMLPWWVRNAKVTGHFVPTTLQVGASLYDGLNPRATGGSNLEFVAEFERAERATPSNDHDLYEYRVDRRLRDAALDWSWRHPGSAVELAFVKFARMWNVWPNESEFRGWTSRVVVAMTYLPALVLGLWGAWQFGRNWPAALCWLPAVYLTLLHVVFVSSLRYREPAMLPLLVLAAAAVMRNKPTN